VPSSSSTLSIVVPSVYHLKRTTGIFLTKESRNTVQRAHNFSFSVLVCYSRTISHLTGHLPVLLPFKKQCEKDLNGEQLLSPAVRKEITAPFLSRKFAKDKKTDEARIQKNCEVSYERHTSP